MDESKYVFGIPTIFGLNMWAEGVSDLQHEENFWISSFTTPKRSPYLEIDPSCNAPDYASTALFQVVDTKTDTKGREIRVVRPICEITAKMCTHLSLDTDAFLWAWLTDEAMEWLSPLVYAYHRKTLFMDLPDALGKIQKSNAAAFEQFESICNRYAQQSIDVKSAVRALEAVFNDNTPLEFVNENDSLPSRRFGQFVEKFDKFIMSSDGEISSIKGYIDVLNKKCAEYTNRQFVEYGISLRNDKYLIGQCRILDSMYLSWQENMMNRVRALTIAHNLYAAPNDFLVGIVHSPICILPKT